MNDIPILRGYYYPDSGGWYACADCAPDARSRVVTAERYGITLCPRRAVRYPVDGASCRTCGAAMGATTGEGWPYTADPDPDLEPPIASDGRPIWEVTLDAALDIVRDRDLADSRDRAVVRAALVGALRPFLEPF